MTVVTVLDSGKKKEHRDSIQIKVRSLKKSSIGDICSPDVVNNHAVTHNFVIAKILTILESNYQLY